MPVTIATPTSKGPNTPVPGTTGFPTTEPLPPTVADVTQGFNPTSLLPAVPTPMAQLRHRHLASTDCFRYLYGTFQTNITIIGGCMTMGCQTDDNQ